MNKLQQLVERDQWAELLTASSSLSSYSIYSQIEILAFSDNQALEKASEIFNVPKEYLLFEKTRKGSSSLLGMIKIPSSYIFSVKEEFKAFHTNNSIEYDEYNDLAQNKNGSFRLIMKKQGLTLQVFPPKGIGHIVTQEEIMTALAQRQYDNINQELIRQALHTFQPVIIAPYVRSEEDDSVFTISLAKDLMEATFRFSKPTNNGRIPDLNEVVQQLKQQHNITIGIKEEYIAEALDNELYNVPIVVAEGIPPKNGIHAYIEYKFSTGADEFKYAVRSDGSINFKELNIIQNVLENDVIAIMHPATKGVVGYTILGDRLEAPDGNPAEWNIGPNVILSSDQTKALATQSGQVYLKNKQICVDPALEIPSDVGLSTGNIDFLGNVIIKGDITDGFSVISGGNIEVFGHVGKCFMFAEGNIIVHQGIQGKDDAQIECKGNLYARFIERASLSVGGNLVITKDLLHSKSIVDKGIYILDEKKSIIAGGNIKAQDEIVSAQIGAESYIETHIEVGYSKNIIRKNQILQKNIEDLSNQLSEYKLQLASTRPNSKEIIAIEKNIISITKQQHKHQVIFEQNKKILQKLSQAASISVSKALMPGVKIKIGTNTLDITAEQLSCTLKNDGQKQLVVEAYQTPSLLAEFVTEAKNNTTKKRK
ncbi:MAG: DUF342 domain-containing protein [Brevinema sp.]